MLIVTGVQHEAKLIHAFLEGVSHKAKKLTFRKLAQRVAIHGTHYRALPACCAAKPHRPGTRAPFEADSVHLRIGHWLVEVDVIGAVLCVLKKSQIVVL